MVTALICLAPLAAMGVAAAVINLGEAHAAYRQRINGWLNDEQRKT